MAQKSISISIPIDQKKEMALTGNLEESEWNVTSVGQGLCYWYHGQSYIVAEKLQPELVDWNDYPDWKWPTKLQNGHSNNSPQKYLYLPLPSLGG